MSQMRFVGIPKSHMHDKSLIDRFVDVSFVAFRVDKLIFPSFYVNRSMHLIIILTTLMLF
jgi:hypothetical protein